MCDIPDTLSLMKSFGDITDIGLVDISDVLFGKISRPPLEFDEEILFWDSSDTSAGAPKVTGTENFSLLLFPPSLTKALGVVSVNCSVCKSFLNDSVVVLKLWED